MIGAARRALAVVAVALAGLGSWGAAPVGSTGLHRAAVIVDTGSEVKRFVVEFGADSISGLEALELAGAQPIVYGYAGQGGAVCALCGRGCPADASCLTCGGAQYWAYFRASAGSDTFTYSQVGAGSTRVGDGDVEGWSWSEGDPPPYSSVEEIAGLAPPPPPPAPVARAAPAAPPSTEAPAPAPAAPGATVTAASPEATATTATPTTPTTAPPTTAAGTASSTSTSAARSVKVVGEEAVARRAAPEVARSGGAGSGPGWSLLAFAAVLAAIAGTGVWLRFRRRGVSAGSF